MEAFQLARAGKGTEAKPWFEEARRVAELLRQDPQSGGNASADTNDINALYDSCAWQGSGATASGCSPMTSAKPERPLRATRGCRPKRFVFGCLEPHRAEQPQSHQQLPFWPAASYSLAVYRGQEARPRLVSFWSLILGLPFWAGRIAYPDKWKGTVGWKLHYETTTAETHTR